MFTGSGHLPYGLHDKLTEGVGGSNNGISKVARAKAFPAGNPSGACH